MNDSLTNAIRTALIVVAGCAYRPTFHDCEIACADNADCPAGFACNADGLCRAPGAVASCHDVLADAGIVPDDSATDSTTVTVDAAPPAIAWVKPFAATTSFQFTAHATHAGDAIVLHAMCWENDPTMQSGVTMMPSSSAWHVTPISGLAVAGNNIVWAATFGAIAPNTADVTFTMSWSTSCTSGVAIIGDEFTNNDPTGGTTTFDAHHESAGLGYCSGSVTPAHAGVAIWGACSAGSALPTVAGVYEPGADDHTGDVTEHVITKDSSGTPVALSFSSSLHLFVTTAVTIRPRAL